jgi:hypothetical protein
MVCKSHAILILFTPLHTGLHKHMEGLTNDVERSNEMVFVPRPSRNLSLKTFSRSQSRDLLEISVPRPSRDLNKNSKFKCQQPNPILIPEDQGKDNYSNPSITDCLAANQGRASNWLGDCHSMPI